MPLLMYKDPTTGQMTPLIGAKSAGRNIVVNGAMRVAQRGPAMAAWPADRFYLSANWDGAFTPGSQETSGPPPGFSHYIRAKVATADTSLTGDQYSHLYTNIEGYRISHLGWGTANAKPATLSFWVRTSIPGVWSGSLRATTVTHSYAFEYTTTTTGWEYKTITIPGPTVGTWPTDTAFCSLVFNQGMSTTCIYRSTTPRTWQVGNFIGSSNQTNMLGTVNATWDLTGVQLEEGTYATPFERVSYDDELRACRRYFYRHTGTAAYTKYGVGVVSTATSAIILFTLPVPMRIPPTLTMGGGAHMLWDASAVPAVTSYVADMVTTDTYSANITASAGGLTVGRGALVMNNNNTAGYIEFSAEA